VRLADLAQHGIVEQAAVGEGRVGGQHEISLAGQRKQLNLLTRAAPDQATSRSF